MHISRLAALSLLISAFTVHGNAQSSAPASPAVPTSPYQLRLYGQLPQLFGKPGANPPANLFKLPRPVPNPLMLPQNTLVANLDAASNLLRGVLAPQPRSEETCYAIRSYAYVRDNPTSDATRLAGSSICQPMSNTQFKAVIDSRIMSHR